MDGVFLPRVKGLKGRYRYLMCALVRWGATNATAQLCVICLCTDRWLVGKDLLKDHDWVTNIENYDLPRIGIENMTFLILFSRRHDQLDVPCNSIDSNTWHHR